MSKLFLLIVSILVCGMTSLAQPPDTTILLPNRLVISSVKRAQPKMEIDTAGLISIVCLVRSDTLIREQQRQLSGKMIGYTDSSVILHVGQETVLSYYRNGTVENFYYSEEEDSLKNHIDTIRFSEIYTISYDKGTFRQVRGILQSTAYLYIVGNIVVLVTAFIVPKTYGNLVTGKNLANTTGIALGAGAASFIFNPKVFRLANQPKRRHRIKWKIEVI
jgi:hypothetical protein